MKNFILILVITILSFSIEAKLEGLYQLNVQFQSGPPFKDLLMIESNGKASFTVPGNFTFPVELLTQGKNFRFVLTGKEGNSSFEFLFEGIENHQGLLGKIKDIPSSTYIGEFYGNQLVSEISCE